ncbi:putative WD repeat-containing protein [Neolecta irregularis DAH-3]|uniref:Putative WD repeat-containing protein n=1 Tax=Neolecta irregularis (strain DAH-3) TaxID=1198029 RepID=A0A1U7LNA9_NEOID|nr:putative WD repeat-containing protein [Neolecta irregularis DAH-3]|eukprot:OLL24011.1 putative WD repeat-containing protein [Neolecta irregularis DAH-3]
MSQFFQSDQNIKSAELKGLKANNENGNPFRLTTKILALTVDDKDENIIYIGGAANIAVKINLKSKAKSIYRGHSGPVTSVVLANIDKDKRLYTGSWDNTIKMWNAETGDCLATLDKHSDFVKCLLYVPQLNMLFSGSSDKSIIGWEIRPDLENYHRKVFVLKGHTRGVEDLALDTSCPDSGHVWIWSAGSDREIRRWKVGDTACEDGDAHIGHETSVYRIKIFDNEMWTASADRTVRRWDLAHGIKEEIKLEHGDYTRDVVIYQGHAITACRDEYIRVWNIETGKLIKKIEGHFDDIVALQIAGQNLISASLDQTIRQWPLKDVLDPKIEFKITALENKRAEITDDEERELDELME